MKALGVIETYGYSHNPTTSATIVNRPGARLAQQLHSEEKIT